MNTTDKSHAKADAAASEYKSRSRKKKAAGRPKGAKTADRVVIKKMISREECPHCHSKAEPVNKRLTSEGKASGELFGQPYSYFRHYACNCAKCGLKFKLSEYEPA